MSIASEIYRSYCESNTIKFIDEKEHLINECEKRCIKEEYNCFYSVTNYTFVDDSSISYCSENDVVEKRGVK